MAAARVGARRKSAVTWVDPKGRAAAMWVDPRERVAPTRRVIGENGKARRYEKLRRDVGGNALRDPRGARVECAPDPNRAGIGHDGRAVGSGRGASPPLACSATRRSTPLATESAKGLSRLGARTNSSSDGPAGPEGLAWSRDVQTRLEALLAKATGRTSGARDVARGRKAKGGERGSKRKVAKCRSILRPTS